MSDRAVTERRRRTLFLAGLAVIAVALSPPLDAVTGRRLSAHMVQHLLFMLVAAPLLAAARPVRPANRVLMHPVVVLTLAVGGFWAWHLPRAYQAALSNPFVHMAEHATFLGGAFLFWTIVFDPGPRRRLGLGATCGFVFAAMLVNIWLAAALAFSTTPLYAVYAARAGAAAAVADQQLAGVIMWLPADLVYFVTLLALLRRILRELDARMPRRIAPEELARLAEADR